MNDRELKEAVKEIKEDILDPRPKPQRRRKRLIFDGRQYSLRFPKKYVEEAEIDINNDEFEIVLELPDPSKADGDKAKIQIELIRHGK